jgi:predicted anti-sigma-YlaC factor YlaD
MVNKVRVVVINCRHVWKEISNYLDGTVDDELRARIEEHVKDCKHCSAVLDGTRNVIQLVGDERVFEVPAGFGNRLKHRLDSEIGGKG